jgi:hypothetical protein
MFHGSDGDKTGGRAGATQVAFWHSKWAGGFKMSILTSSRFLSVIFMSTERALYAWKSSMHNLHLTSKTLIKEDLHFFLACFEA